MNDHETILQAIVKLFRSFPASKGVDRDTLQDYCEAVASYPGSVVERVVERFRMGEIAGQNRTFAPSIAEMTAELRRSGMNEDERRAFFSRHRHKAIQSSPDVIVLAQQEAKRRNDK